MIKAIFFDFDGVLTTDSTGTVSIMKYIEKHTSIDREKFEKAYRKHNYNLLYGHTTHEEVWEQICSDMDEVIDIEVLYEAFYNTPLDNEMIELAKKLKAQDYVIGMITDNKADRIEKTLAYFNLTELFNIITISAEVGSGKKEEAIFNEAVLNHRLSFNDSIFIDNSAANLIVPDSKGMHTIFYDHDKRDFNSLQLQLKQLLSLKERSL